MGKCPDLRTLVPAAARFSNRSADFDGDRRAEILVSHPAGIALLKCTAGTLAASVAVANGTRIGHWLLNTGDNFIGPVGDLDGDGNPEILVTTPCGVGIVRKNAATTAAPTMEPNGTPLGKWLLNPADNDLGHGA